MNQAVLTGDVELLDLLVKTHAVERYDELDELGNSPVLLSIMYDRPEVLELLLKRGVDPHNYCDGGIQFGNCLFYAISYEQIRILDVLGAFDTDFQRPVNSLNESAFEHAEV